MSRAKIALAVCASALALAAVGSASASAAEWHVAGAPLGSGKSAALAEATTPVKGFELVIVGSGLSVSCAGLQNNSAAIVGANSFEAKSLTFTGCKSNSANCPVTPTISTTEVLGTAAPATSPASTLEVQPKAGAEKLLMELVFTGETCAFTILPVKGNFTFTLPTGQTEQSGQELFVSSSKLKTASNTDTLTGAIDAKLVSGSPWSFR